jgi:hypothetical protein
MYDAGDEEQLLIAGSGEEVETHWPSIWKSWRNCLVTATK